jgi:hypothetical protein
MSILADAIVNLYFANPEAAAAYAEIFAEHNSRVGMRGNIGDDFHVRNKEPSIGVFSPPHCKGSIAEQRRRFERMT